MPISVLVVEPGKPAEERVVNLDLQTVRGIVGGRFTLWYVPTEVYGSSGYAVALYCNEEADLLGLPPCRKAPGRGKQMFTGGLIRGSFVLFATKKGGGNPRGLPPSLLRRLQDHFNSPEAQP